MTRFRPSWNAWLLLALTVLAAGLRLYKLDEAVLSRDEGSSWRVSRYEPLELIRHCAANVHAPLSFFLLKWWTGVFGDSVFAMRSLSLLFGTLCVPAICLLVIEARRYDSHTTRHNAISATSDTHDCAHNNCTTYGFSVPTSQLHSGAIAAAALVAVHPLQLEIARTARMYSICAFFTLLSTLLLLRALRCIPNSIATWLGYSFAATGLAYTHLYGLFTIAAHFLFVVLSLTAAYHGNRTTGHYIRNRFACFTLSACIIFVFYGRWIPITLKQVNEVSRGYWIGRMTQHDILNNLVEWTIGDPLGFNAWRAVALLTCVFLFALYACWTSRSAMLFLAISTFPWVGIAFFYASTGHSVMQLRYVAMAQGAFFVLFVAATESGGFARRICVLLYSGQVAVSGAAYLSLPTDPYQLPALTQWLAARYEVSDSIVVAHVGELTRTQYYLTHAGTMPPTMYTELATRHRIGHIAHLASLRREDIVYPDDSRLEQSRRLWHISDSRASQPTFYERDLALASHFGTITIRRYDQTNTSRICK